MKIKKTTNEPVIDIPRLKQAAEKPKISQVFLGVDMRNSHNGLTNLCEKYNIDLPNLLPNLLIVFINRRQTMMKIYVAGNTISFTKRDRISLDVIAGIPKFFGAKGAAAYDEALKENLKKELRGENE